MPAKRCLSCCSICKFILDAGAHQHRSELHCRSGRAHRHASCTESDTGNGCYTSQYNARYATSCLHLVQAPNGRKPGSQDEHVGSKLCSRRV